MRPDIVKSIKKTAMLCALGVALGTGMAWYQVTGEMNAAGYAALAPAAGEEVAGSSVGGPFALTDENGKAVTEKDYAGYKIVFFGFTHCPDICPAGLQKISAALDTLGADGEKITPLFITVDPARDTPDVMKTYTDIYSPRIVGLTGTEAQVKAAEETYKVYASKAEPEPAAHEGHGGGHGDHSAHGAPANYQVNHSGFIYFMSPDDKLVGIFRSEDTPDVIAAEIKKALGES